MKFIDMFAEIAVDVIEQIGKRIGLKDGKTERSSNCWIDDNDRE